MANFGVRRVSDTFQFLIDYYEGKNDAVRKTQRRLELDLSNFDALISAADTMYLTRNFSEAERLYVEPLAETCQGVIREAT